MLESYGKRMEQQANLADAALKQHALMWHAGGSGVACRWQEFDVSLVHFLLWESEPGYGRTHFWNAEVAGKKRPSFSFGFFATHQTSVVVNSNVRRNLHLLG